MHDEDLNVISFLLSANTRLSEGGDGPETGLVVGVVPKGQGLNREFSVFVQTETVCA